MTVKIQKPGEPPYGLPYDDMHKGYVMPVHEVEEVVGHPQDSRAFGLGVMGLVATIDRELALRGENVTVVTIKSAVHILTDPEAADHNARQAELKRTAWARKIRKLAQVDASNLDEDHRERHRQTLVFESRLLQAVRAEKRKARKELAAREEHAQIEGK